jgi:dephospho-CoA kinase
LTGLCCSGKDTLAEYIVKKYQYKHYSLSNIIVNMLMKDCIEPTRENLISFAVELRKKEGNGILAKKVLEKIDDNSNYCISSIRHPDEIKEIRKIWYSILINVYASQNIRFRRMCKRKRIGDPNTLDAFIKLENLENKISCQQKVIDMSDIMFSNDSNNIVDFEIAVEKLFKNIEDFKST